MEQIKLLLRFIKMFTHCDRSMSRNGKTESGAQRYRCRICNASHTDSDNPPHRPCEGEEPLTQVEKNQRYRNANREKYRAAQKVRRDNKKNK
jgi:transposase-like protein